MKVGHFSCVVTLFRAAGTTPHCSASQVKATRERWLRAPVYLVCHRIHGKRIPQTARGAGRAPAGRPLETVRRVLGQASRLLYSVQLYRASVSVPTTLYPTPPVFLTGPG
jgi:hypothetical protein